MNRIFYNFASRSRPIKFFETLDLITSLATYPNYFILCTLDKDDSSMTTVEIMDRVLTYSNKVWAIWGESKNKIDAINKNVHVPTEWDILINVSDDTRFLLPGFDQIIIDDMQQHFPDLDGVLHYPDSHTGVQLMTLSVIGKKYYDRFGYIYHPDYVSLYADLEATDVAKKLNKYKFIDKNIYDHFHPVWGKGEWDDQYRRTESYYVHDQATYNRRRAINFDLR